MIKWVFRCRLLAGVLLWAGLLALPAAAEGRFIVRVPAGRFVLQTLCAAIGCNVAETIDGATGRLFLVTVPNVLNVDIVLGVLNSSAAVVGIEPDLLANTEGSTYRVPSALSDTTPVTYYGATVPHGYVSQPAAEIVRIADAQNNLNVSGAGIVAVIDTGVDVHHPALERSLLPGYDFTRNQSGADETLDVNLIQPPTSGSSPQWVNGHSAANLDQSTAAVVDGNNAYSDFGHGTMVAGIIHLVAPTAKILPLKAFRADGTGYTSDILRAIYTAIALHANVLNMSFNLAAYSPEVANAINVASLGGMICVAAAGNSGQDTLVYPAALSNVMGIASTTDTDQLSLFSNYGSDLVWVAAPGEGIVSTYPFSTYAAGWGTSFSTPFISGTAALMVNVNFLCNQWNGANSTAHARPLGPMVGHGRLDAFQAVQAWVQASGLP
jgi:hypothetical protein